MEHEQKWRSTQGDAPPSASLALGYHRSRFQRFCRFAARDIVGALGFACWPLAPARAKSPHHGRKTGALGPPVALRLNYQGLTDYNYFFMRAVIAMQGPLRADKVCRAFIYPRHDCGARRRNGQLT